MSQQRYTLEFKDEAVRPVTERGHSAQEVAAHLVGVIASRSAPSAAEVSLPVVTRITLYASTVPI